jgi:hypothetical protein
MKVPATHKADTFMTKNIVCFLDTTKHGVGFTYITHVELFTSHNRCHGLAIIIIIIIIIIITIIT